MKGLYKKISAGVLALALVLGGSLSQGAMAYADSGQERWQEEINRCDYELEKPHKPSGFSWEDEYEQGRNRSLLKESEDRYNYQVLGEHKEDPKPGEENYYLKKYYESIFDFFDCMNNHLDKHRPNGVRYYNIGGVYFEILFK